MGKIWIPPEEVSRLAFMNRVTPTATSLTLTTDHQSPTSSSRSLTRGENDVIIGVQNENAEDPSEAESEVDQHGQEDKERENNHQKTVLRRRNLLGKFRMTVSSFFRRYLTENNDCHLQFNISTTDFDEKGDQEEEAADDDTLLCNCTCPNVDTGIDKFRQAGVVGPFGESYIVGTTLTGRLKNHSSQSVMPLRSSSLKVNKQKIQLVEANPSEAPSDESMEEQGKCNRRCKKMCPCLTKEIPVNTSDYIVKLNPDNRTEHTLVFIVDTYNKIKAKHIEMEQDKTVRKSLLLLHQHLLDTFKHCKNAINFMHRVHLFCGDAIKSLSYYFEPDLTDQQLAFLNSERERRKSSISNPFANASRKKIGADHSSTVQTSVITATEQLIEGRSVIGSYVWVIIMCMKSIRSTVDYSSEDFDETRRTLEDAVGLSSVIWKGVKHIGEAFIQCRKKTEKTILTRCIDRFDPALSINAHLKLQSTMKEKKKSYIKMKKAELRLTKRNLAMERKKRIAQLKHHNKVGGNQELLELVQEKELSLPPPPAVRITKNFLIGTTNNNNDDNNGGLGWTPFDGLKPTDRLATLNALCKKVVQIYEEVQGHLRNLDSALHQIMHDDTVTYETSYYEAISFMGKCLARVTSRRERLRSEDCAAIVEMGKLLNDELDLTEFFIMTLRQLAHESRHAIHVSYEFARLFQRCSLPPYELISPPDIRRCRGLERIGLKTNFEDIEFRKITLRQAVAQFNTSPYIEILMVFPVRGKNYQLRVEPLPSLEMHSFSQRGSYPSRNDSVDTDSKRKTKDIEK